MKSGIGNQLGIGDAWGYNAPISAADANQLVFVLRIQVDLISPSPPLTTSVFFVESSFNPPIEVAITNIITPEVVTNGTEIVITFNVLLFDLEFFIPVCRFGGSDNFIVFANIPTPDSISCIVPTLPTGGPVLLEVALDGSGGNFFSTDNSPFFIQYKTGLCTAVNDCSGNGRCLGNDICECDSGFLGAACDFALVRNVSLIAGIGLLVIILTIGLVVFLIRRKNQRKKARSANVYEKTNLELTNQAESGYIGIHTRESFQSEWAVNVKTIEGVKIGDELLGKGNFSEVYKGSWNGSTVAVKKMKKENWNAEVLKEIHVLESINHPNVVRYFGICGIDVDNFILVLEYLPLGDVRKLLLNNRNTITLKDLNDMITDVILGMKYLHSQKIIHRDLAARNLLASSSDVKGKKYVVKISDFGLSKKMQQETTYYSTLEKSVPIKWSAPEVLTKGKFS